MAYGLLAATHCALELLVQIIYVIHGTGLHKYLAYTQTIYQYTDKTSNNRITVPVHGSK